MRAEKTTRDTAIPSNTHTTHQSVQPPPLPPTSSLPPLPSLQHPYPHFPLSLPIFIHSFLPSFLPSFLLCFLPPSLPSPPFCPTIYSSAVSHSSPCAFGSTPSAYTVCLDRTEMQRGDCRRKHLLYGSDYITSYTA